MSARQAFPLLGVLLMLAVTTASLFNVRTSDLLLQGKPERAPA